MPTIQKEKTNDPKRKRLEYLIIEMSVKKMKWVQARVINTFVVGALSDPCR